MQVFVVRARIARSGRSGGVQGRLWNLVPGPKGRRFAFAHESVRPNPSGHGHLERQVFGIESRGERETEATSESVDLPADRLDLHRRLTAVQEEAIRAPDPNQTETARTATVVDSLDSPGCVPGQRKSGTPQAFVLPALAWLRRPVNR